MLYTIYKKARIPLLFFVVLSLVLTSCGTISLGKRSDMPIRGSRVFAYSITQPDTSATDNKRVDNTGTLTGIGDDAVYAPFPLVETTFNEQPGLKRQTVKIGNEPVLSMTKPKRGLGYTKFAQIEPASICAHDALGGAACGMKVRIKFNRNLAEQLLSSDEWDYDAVMYYTVPATWNGGIDYTMDLSKAHLLSTSVTQVSQLRFGWGKSFFFNMNEGAVIVGGKPERMTWEWWRETEEIPGDYNDMMDAVHLISDMVNDLETSPTRWLDFNPNGQFADSWVKYSIGDADTYFTPERAFLNRQKAYAVAYRKDRAAAWQFRVIEPRYNFEFNDFDQFVSQDAISNLVDRNGKLKTEISTTGASDLKELETIGCQNCPNPALEQVAIYNPANMYEDYTITFRSYHGANDTLVIYGPDLKTWQDLVAQAPKAPTGLQRPIDYDENGKEKQSDQQHFPDQASFDRFVAEATVWNWLTKGNPLKADMQLQYRINDQSEVTYIPCSDGGICGVDITRWNLSASYFMDGDSMRPWLVSQLFGESGVRTLGFSFVSGRFEGFGGNFALGHDVFLNQYQHGFVNPEIIFAFDSRALTTPAMLDLEWAALTQNE